MMKTANCFWRLLIAASTALCGMGCPRVMDPPEHSEEVTYIYLAPLHIRKLEAISPRIGPEEVVVLRARAENALGAVKELADTSHEAKVTYRYAEQRKFEAERHIMHGLYGNAWTEYERLLGACNMLLKPQTERARLDAKSEIELLTAIWEPAEHLRIEQEEWKMQPRPPLQVPLSDLVILRSNAEKTWGKVKKLRSKDPDIQLYLAAAEDTKRRAEALFKAGEYGGAEKAFNLFLSLCRRLQSAAEKVASAGGGLRKRPTTKPAATKPSGVPR